MKKEEKHNQQKEVPNEMSGGGPKQGHIAEDVTCTGPWQRQASGG